MAIGPQDYTRFGDTSVPERLAGPGPRTAWAGWLVFASLMMGVIGLVHLGAGFIALFQQDYYTVTPRGLAISTNFTAWGWTQILLGAVVLLAAVFLLRGLMWARIATVIVAMLSIIVDFIYFPITPVWSGISITLTVFSIYAVIVHGGDPDVLD